eukprot:15189566-Alexandrium_andersonii.AAC.1
MDESSVHGDPAMWIAAVFTWAWPPRLRHQPVGFVGVLMTASRTASAVTPGTSMAALTWSGTKDITSPYTASGH